MVIQSEFELQDSCFRRNDLNKQSAIINCN
jgi:hypothetical protein